MRPSHAALAAVALGLLLPAVAAASQQSELIYSRGLVEFHAQRYTDALRLFEQAVAADPNDAYALYYRGVTRGRLRDFEGAVVDLRAALERQPALKEGTLELGVALVESGHYTEAKPWLEQAEQVPELAPEAALFLGVAQLRLGEDDAARESFSRAAAGRPELQTSARYYQGVAAYQAGRWTESESHFTEVLENSPNTEMGREANEFLRVVRAHQARRYHLRGAVAFEYDSNVRLSPSGDALEEANLPNQGRADGRMTVLGGASYVPWRNDDALVSVGYEFFQSGHFKLSEFNLQDHRPYAEFVGRYRDLTFGLLGRYDYYRLEDDQFLQEGTVSPWVTLLDKGFGRTEFFYRMRRRDFLDNDFEVRNSFNHAPGIAEVIELDGPNRYVAFGYRYDREDPTRADDISKAFGYDGHEVSVGVGWILPGEIVSDTSYAFRRELYDPQSNHRQDNEHRIIAILYRNITEYMRLTCSYFGTINDSNKDLFQYNRHIGSIGVELRY